MNFNQLDDMDLKLLKPDEGHKAVAWFRACSLACIDKTTDSNVLQETQAATRDLCTLVSGVSGIGAGFTYSTIFRFFVFIQFLLPGLNLFLHLARPAGLLYTCLGHSFFSSSAFSPPASLRLCLLGRCQ